MLASHYAPSKSLTLLPGVIEQCETARFESARPGPLGLLLQSGDPEEAARALATRTGMTVIARSLSPSGDRDEAARHLFAHLRALDASAALALFAEPCPDETGLGHAIADRLRRAAATR